ncbi:MAG: glutaredoxin family protein [Candidatus Woesearchaeota archaeon]
MKYLWIMIAIIALAGCSTDNNATGDAVSEINEDSSDGEKVTVYFFWGDGCPHCATEKTFLEQMESKYPIEVKMFETYKNPENAQYFQEFAQAHEFQARGVPATFIGEEHWVGFAERMKEEMEEKIKDCIDNGCPDPGDKVN